MTGAARSLFDILFTGAPEGWVGVGPPDKLQYHKPSELPDEYPQDADIYFTPALHKNQANAKSDVYGTRVLWADVDRGELPLATLPPSIVVSTGRGFHLYWLLDKWETDLDSVESANQSLTQDVGGDHTFNANRLLRVPSTTNHKHEAPLPCTIVSVSGNIYSLAECAAVTRLSERVRDRIRSGDARGYKSRSERDWRVICDLVENGFSDETIRAIFTHHKVGNKFRDPHTEGESYLTHTLEQARADRGARAAVSTTPAGHLAAGDDGYYKTSGRGTRRISTFTLEAEELVEGDAEDTFVCTVRAGGREWPGVAFNRSAFNSKQTLDRQLKHVEWVWEGTDADVRALLPHLYEQFESRGLPRRRATSVLGLHRHAERIWFVGDSGHLVDRPSPPSLVYLPTGREHPHLRLDATPEWGAATERGAGILQQIGALLPHLNTPDVIWPIIGWYCAAPFKPEIESWRSRFPSLAVFGTRGSGKTTTILRVMLPLFCQVEPRTYDSRTTAFALLSLLGSSNAVPVALAEFRAAHEHKLLQYILQAYDSGYDLRGRPDQTTTAYPLSAPFSLDGEDLIVDSAARERILAVGFNPAAIQEGEPAWQTLRTLEALSPYFNSWGASYLTYVLTTLADGRAKAAWESARAELWSAFTQTLPDRVRNNLTVSRFGSLMFSGFTGEFCPDATVLTQCLENVYNTKAGRAQIGADDFVADLVNALANGETRLSWRGEGALIYFQLRPAYNWWAAQRHRGGTVPLALDSIERQLTQLPYVRPSAFVNNRTMVAVDLPGAKAAGLDVPSHLTSQEFTVRI